jgi:hypothetical protein
MSDFTLGILIGVGSMVLLQMVSAICVCQLLKRGQW